MKRTAFGVFLSSAACALLCSCASVPVQNDRNERLSKRFEAPAEPGWCGLYVFRDGRVGSALTRNVYVDGHYIGKTGYKTFFHRLVRPGQHWLQTESSSGNRELKIEARAGENVFVRQKMSLSGKVIDDPIVRGLSAGDMFLGETELVECSRIEAVPAIRELRLAADMDDPLLDLDGADPGEDKGSRPAHEAENSPLPPDPVVPHPVQPDSEPSPPPDEGKAGEIADPSPAPPRPDHVVDDDAVIAEILKQAREEASEYLNGDFQENPEP